MIFFSFKRLLLTRIYFRHHFNNICLFQWSLYTDNWTFKNLLPVSEVFIAVGRSILRVNDADFFTLLFCKLFWNLFIIHVVNECSLVTNVFMYLFMNIKKKSQIALRRKVWETKALEIAINHVLLFISGRRMWWRGIRWQKKR